MGTYYNQQGHPEIWKEKPEGYFTLEEWQAIQPNPELPKPLTLIELRELKIEEINAGYTQAIRYVQAGYPLEEILSWDIQFFETMALLNDPANDAVFVRQLAKVKGVTVSEMRDRILANAESWQFVAGLLTAQRQVMEEAAMVAQSIPALEAIVVTYTV